MSTDKGVPSSRQEVLNLVDKHGKVDLSVRNRGHDVDYDKAFALAVLSKAVYWGGVTGEGDDDIHDVGERLLVKYRSIQTFYRENAAAFILECDDVIVLAWRGSDDLKDWISHNFWAFPVLLDGRASFGYVHLGFESHVDLLWGDVCKELRRLTADGKKVVFTGHSLGGAAALVCACRFAKENGTESIDSVVTFGQPHVFGKRAVKKMAILFGDNYLRYTFNLDPVPRILEGVPCPSFVEGSKWRLTFRKFRHAGHKVNLKARRLPKHPGYNPMNRFLHVDDHSMRRYLRALYKLSES